MADPANRLYYGDNLDVLRRHLADESVDSVYLDPPFKSNQDYNVLFAEHNGTRAASQIKAFEDTWQWDESAARALEELIEAGGAVSDAMQALRRILGDSDMMAYLAMMAPRLVELKGKLKPTGSIYLHCDPTASHYLKVLMDAVFRPHAFRNEIIWHRTPFAGSSKARARQFPRTHDVILFFAKGESWTWNGPTLPYKEEYVERFKWDDGDGRGPYRKTLLKTFSKETFERLKAENRLVAPVKKGAKWSYKQYLSESSGRRQIDDVWTDVNALNPVAKERLGYPTQKPEALLERIITASSNEGDVVLDPFCGCGTTIAAAQRLKRHWIGIDITHLAINLIRTRLANAYPGIEKTYNVIGEPTSLSDAEELAATDPYQFQWWALGLVGARPIEQKKGADKGIDGRLIFHDEKTGGEAKQIIFSVKAGKVQSSQVRDLVGVIAREKAAIGALISFEEPTREMRKEAASAGYYSSPWGTKHPRIQLLTVAELLEGKKVDRPPTATADATFKKAARVEYFADQMALGYAAERSDATPTKKKPKKRP